MTRIISDLTEQGYVLQLVNPDKGDRRLAAVDYVFANWDVPLGQVRPESWRHLSFEQLESRTGAQI